MELTSGTLLGGQVIYRQPRVGYRTGIEPVLLAASVPAQPGETVLEAGTGAGAALLCLLARLPAASAVGVEQDGGLAALATANLLANGMALASVIHADLLDLPAAAVRSWAPFDHAMVNPPWHDANGSASPNVMRDGAKRADATVLGAWAAALSRLIRPGGTLTVIVPAASVAAAMAATAAAGGGDLTILPLWPRAGQEARLVLLQSTKAGRGPCRVLPGLVLHDAAGYTEVARRVLWDGSALRWA